MQKYCNFVRMILRIAGLVLLILLSSGFHPVHVSVTNMDIDPESGQVNVTIKLFSDDLEELIGRKYGVHLRITAQEDPGEKIEALNRYIGETFHFSVNGNDPVPLKYNKLKLGEQAIWLYYTYDHKGKIRKMEVRNNLMLEKFKDQTNLLILSYHDIQNGYRLNNKNTDLSLNIK